MRDIPLEVLVNFPTPNYVDPVTRGNALVIVDAVLIPIIVIAVGLRYYTRIFMKRWFGKDDFFIGLAMISTIGLNVAVILAVSRYCWNRHIWDIPFSLSAPALKIAMISKLFFSFAATFTRHSLLCFYNRLVMNAGIKWFRIVIYISQAFVFAVGVVFVVLTIWQCHPISAYWTYPPHPTFEAHCLSEGVVTLASGIINCVADLLVTVLPYPLISRLNMPRSQRASITVLLSLGYVVTAAGVVRTYFIWKSLLATWDETWYTYPLWIATTVEINLGVLCASAPALRPFFHSSASRAPLSRLSTKLSSLFSASSASTSASISAAGSRSSAAPPVPRRCEQRRFPRSNVVSPPAKPFPPAAPRCVVELASSPGSEEPAAEDEENAGAERGWESEGAERGWDRESDSEKRADAERGWLRDGKGTPGLAITTADEEAVVMPPPRDGLRSSIVGVEDVEFWRFETGLSRD